MTKKDFELIADIVANAPLRKATDLKLLADHVERELATHVHNFDSEIFEGYVTRKLLERSIRERENWSVFSEGGKL